MEEFLKWQVEQQLLQYENLIVHWQYWKRDAHSAQGGVLFSGFQTRNLKTSLQGNSAYMVCQGSRIPVTQCAFATGRAEASPHLAFLLLWGIHLGSNYCCRLQEPAQISDIVGPVLSEEIGRPTLVTRLVWLVELVQTAEVGEISIQRSSTDCFWGKPPSHVSWRSQSLSWRHLPVH